MLDFFLTLITLAWPALLWLDLNKQNGNWKCFLAKLRMVKPQSEFCTFVWVGFSNWPDTCTDNLTSKFNNTKLLGTVTVHLWVIALHCASVVRWLRRYLSTAVGNCYDCLSVDPWPMWLQYILVCNIWVTAHSSNVQSTTHRDMIMYSWVRIDIPSGSLRKIVRNLDFNCSFKTNQTGIAMYMCPDVRMHFHAYVHTHMCIYTHIRRLLIQLLIRACSAFKRAVSALISIGIAESKLISIDNVWK